MLEYYCPLHGQLEKLHCSDCNPEIKKKEEIDQLRKENAELKAKVDQLDSFEIEYKPYKKQYISPQDSCIEMDSAIFDILQRVPPPYRLDVVIELSKVLNSYIASEKAKRYEYDYRRFELRDPYRDHVKKLDPNTGKYIVFDEDPFDPYKYIREGKF